MTFRPSRSARQRALRFAAAGGAAALVATVSAVPARAATPLSSFTSGDIVVEQVGDGTTTLSSHGNVVYLDEFTPAGALVGSLEVTQNPTSYPQLQESGTATYDGELTLSGDGSHLIVPGYDVPAGNTSSLTGTASATVPRVAASVSSAGSVDLSTAVTNFASAQNYRSATSADGLTNFWLAGNKVANGAGNGGVAVAADGSSTSTEVSGQSAGGTGQIQDYQGNLYAVSRTASTGYTVAEFSGLPTAASTPTPLPGFPTATGGALPSPVSIFLATLNPNATSGPDTIYLTDDTVVPAGSTTPGEIEKWSLVGGTWSETGFIACNTCRGLTGTVSQGAVSLYATSSDINGSATSTAGYLYSYTDSTGFDTAPTAGATASLLYTAPANEAFRGVALAPTAVVAPETPEAPWAILLPVAGGGLLLGGGMLLRRRSPKTAPAKTA